MARRPHEYLCGVPQGHCVGHPDHFNASLDGNVAKIHTTHIGAFNCMKAYLLRQGYVQIGAREFSPPDGGPVRVLTKKSHFGGLLRCGKEATRMEPVGSTRCIITHC